MDFMQRPREITPLRETVRVMHTDTTTTDHTSDNDSSLTDSSDYATDDQFIPTRPYNVVPSYPVQGRGGFRPTNPNVRYYDPAKFQRMDSAIVGQQGKSQETGGFQKANVYRELEKKNTNINTSEALRDNLYSASPPKQMSTLSYSDFSSPPSKDGPVPQVPPLPKNFSYPQASSSWEPAVSQPPSMQTVTAAQEREMPPVPRQFSKPQSVPFNRETSPSELPASQSVSLPHDISPEREVPWPQGGPPPYSKEQSHLV